MHQIKVQRAPPAAYIEEEAWYTERERKEVKRRDTDVERRRR